MLQKQTATGCGPGGRGCEKLAGWKHPLNTATAVKFQPSPIRAELIGSTCKAAGITTRGHAPVLVLCRELIATGCDPDRAMQVFRNATLALRVRSIGEAAKLEVNSKGTSFVKHRHAVRRASSVRKSNSVRPRVSPELPQRGRVS